jgi:hypothetical protein
VVIGFHLQYQNCLHTFQKKFEGTRVTIENFLAWKTKFDAEMAELNKNRNDNEIARSKLTGNYKCVPIFYQISTAHQNHSSNWWKTCPCVVAYLCQHLNT